MLESVADEILDLPRPRCAPPADLGHLAASSKMVTAASSKLAISRGAAANCRPRRVLSEERRPERLRSAVELPLLRTSPIQLTNTRSFWRPGGSRGGLATSSCSWA